MVPGATGHLLGTTGSAFTKQTYGGTILGLSAATPIITKSILIKDVNASDITNNTLPKVLSGDNTYNTQKALSAGTFAYNAAKAGKWILAGFTTTISGVSNTALLFVSSSETRQSIPYYRARNYINNISLVRKNLFSRTGYDTSGNKIVKRIPWVTNPTGAAGSDFGTSTSLPSRAVPGEFVLLTNFIDYNTATSSNYYNYSPITGK